MSVLQGGGHSVGARSSHVVEPRSERRGHADRLGRLLTIDEACRRAAAYARVVDGTETVPLRLSLGRTLIRDLVASHACPPFDQSAMDGYALCAGGRLSADSVLAVEGRIAAGQSGHPIRVGTAVRIFTGAPLPVGADAVVMQEQVEGTRAAITLRGPVVSGDHLRLHGEDVSPGSRLAEAGERLAAGGYEASGELGAR